MKKILIAKARWEFYVSNVLGLIAVLALGTWFIVLAFEDGELQFTSIFFWLALILFFFVPFGLITVFSAIKSVVVTEVGITISYTFKSHTNTISFSEISELISSTKATDVKTTTLKDSFILKLKDGRAFEFSKSQFDNYIKLKSLLYKAITRNVR